MVLNAVRTAVFVTVIMAPGITPPVESLTVPEILPPTAAHVTLARRKIVASSTSKEERFANEKTSLRLFKNPLRSIAFLCRWEVLCFSVTISGVGCYQRTFRPTPEEFLKFL